jgi:DNA adenine methylase
MIRSMVKWPGGKSRVMPELLPHLPKGECLVEPFVGGASVFLNTDYPRYVLADINPDLIRLYREAKSHPDLLIDTVRTLFAQGNSKEAYASNRKIFNNTKGLLDVHRAALFLYLNRHGYNGVVRYNQQGGITCRLVNTKPRPISRKQKFACLPKKPTTPKPFFCALHFRTPSR